MKNLITRTITALSLVTALGIAAPIAANADSTTASSTTPTTVAPTAKAPTAWTTWHATWMTYISGLKSINATYHASVQSARAAYDAAKTAATTKQDRLSALSALNTALAAAINIRVAAITSWGDPPAPPAGYNGTAYVTGIQAANVAFRAAVALAQSNYATAIATATPAQSRLARIALQGAIGAALVARSAALTLLGTPPSHPGKTS